MPVIQRSAIAALILVAVLGAAALGAFVSLDRLLADARFAFTNRPASGQVVFADIDSATLAKVGIWPWPREVHATLLDRLMEAGATEVAFDIDFSTRSNPASDAALARSLRAAEGRVYLAAFDQMAGAGGERRLSQAIPEFSAHATPAAMNVAAARDGFVESLPATTKDIPSLSVVLGGQPAIPAHIHIDFGIDLRTVDRVPVHALLDRTVDRQRIAGKQVVVGASAVELRDIYAVPRYGLVPGPLVQIAGIETMKANRPLLPLGGWPATIAALLLGAVWVQYGSGLRVRNAVWVAIGVILLAVGVSFALQALFGITLELAGFLLAVLFLLGLHVSLRFAVEFARRRQAEAQLVHLARHDPVTDVLSRRGLIDRIDAEPPGPILLVALTRLDLVRGTLGRVVADGALREAAARFAALGAGTLAVVDRDVFALALPAQTTPTEVDRLGREVRRALRPAVVVDGHEVHVDAVLAATDVEPGLPAEVRLQRAELALQRAIADPTTGVTSFAPAMEEEVARRRRIDSALRQAIERRELKVVFQPQARAIDGELVGVEALVRWTCPDLGPLSPAEFIPIAEETGLIVPLGRFVLVESCRAAMAWDWGGRLAVNVSGAQFKLGNVPRTVADALAETGFDPGRLDLEVTESVVVDGYDKVRGMLAALKEMGVGIAIDDFGTGYSSLSYLTRLSFDKLKIDQSFVRRLGNGGEEAAVVRTVIELAQRLGKTTVAEGVETEEQRALLIEMGCDICQGWLIGKPVPAAQIAERIAAARAA